MTLAAIYAALLCLCGIIAVGIEAIVANWDSIVCWVRNRPFNQARQNAPNHPGEL